MPAILSITYTPNYPGNHRICFRTTQSAYCCYNDDSTSIVGVPKTTEIDLADFEFCLQDLPAEVGCIGSTVNGYIQPICIEQSSDVNRIEFTADFPSSACTPYQILCTESGIAEITVTDSGSGWLPGEVPNVTITDLSGSGSGAVVTAVMRCTPEEICEVQSITIDQVGQDYYDLTQIQVTIDPPPGYGGDLVVNGDFTTDISGWSIYNEPAGVGVWSPDYGGSIVWDPVDQTEGIYQNILTVGHTYTVNINLVINTTIDPCDANFIIYAGTTPYGPLIFTGEQNFTFDITCTDTPEFRIECTDGNSCAASQYCTYVSVVDTVTGLLATAEVTALDDCGTFTVPNCDGTANPTTYSIWGGEQHAINVCAGGAGPDAFKYTVTSNPTYGGLGSELIVNNEFTTDLSGWTTDNPGSVIWSSNYDGSANFGASDALVFITQDILTVGQTYTVNVDLSIIFNSTPGWCSPTSQGYTQFNVYAGTAVYGPLNFSGSESFTFEITCTDNPTFKIEAWDPDGCTYDETANIAQMFCSYASVKEVGIPVPVSCCDCVKYDVVNNCYFDGNYDIYYTDCNQVIQTLTVGETPTTICCVRGSAWPVNKDDNPCIEITLSNTQDC